jgi:hypothetical protein
MRGRARYPEYMENSARNGLGTRVLAWALLFIVALIVLKFAFGVFLGLLQVMVTIAVLAVVALGVLWALRHV